MSKDRAFVEIERETFNSVDDLGVMLRGHFLVERCARQACANLVPNFISIEKRRARYLSDLLFLLELRDAPKDVIEPARVLNTIRNKAAHEAKWNLEPEDIAALVAAMPAEFRAIHRDGLPIHKSGFNFVWGDANLRAHFAMIAGDLGKYLHVLEPAADFSVPVPSIWKGSTKMPFSDSIT